MNTTDVRGFKIFFSTIYQIMSILKIQYYFNIEQALSDCKNDKEKHEFIKRSLMTIRKEQSMKLSWKEHKEFLNEWSEDGGKKNN